MTFFYIFSFSCKSFGEVQCEPEMLRVANERFHSAALCTAAFGDNPQGIRYCIGAGILAGSVAVILTYGLPDAKKAAVQGATGLTNTSVEISSQARKIAQEILDAGGRVSNRHLKLLLTEVRNGPLYLSGQRPSFLSRAITLNRLSNGLKIGGAVLNVLSAAASVYWPTTDCPKLTFPGLKEADKHLVHFNYRCKRSIHPDFFLLDNVEQQKVTRRSPDICKAVIDAVTEIEENIESPAPSEETNYSDVAA